MKNKFILAGGALLLACGIIFTGSTSAAGFLSKNILRSTSILGISVAKNDAMKYSFVQESDSPNDQVFSLPALSGNDGMMYIVRHYGDNGDHVAAIIMPQSGDHIEGSTDYLYIGGSNTTKGVTLIADEATDSWWIVSNYKI